MVSKCISEKGKTWEGKMKGKRGKYLGQSGKVIEVDKAKDALLVEFASDNTQMWWGTLYLTAADGKELLAPRLSTRRTFWNWPAPDISSEW